MQKVKHKGFVTNLYVKYHINSSDVVRVLCIREAKEGAK